VSALELERAGVAYDAKRGVTVDDRLRTTNARVYAVGDVCSPLQFTHAADFQARLVVQNALFFGRGKASALVTPRVTYTSPEVASVGLSEREAAAKGVPVDVVTIPLHEVDRARLDDETEGYCRVVLARGTDRIVGATIVAEHAGENIGEVVLAMTAKLGLSAIGRTMHPYPTQGEMLRKAADSWRRRKLTPTVQALFARYFRWFR
jgi:pyruvate/2-oxoglutarate dehydrogenase complex dihydrolipoamide dehydrogenase (E3) component